MSDIESLNFDGDESLHIERPMASPISKINAHNRGLTKQKLTYQIHTKYINVLQNQKPSGKIILNPQFQLHLTQSLAQSVKNVSIMGTKRIGKSFLLDCLLSQQSGQVQRLMSKNQQQLVNTPPFMSKGERGERIIYFDCNGQPHPSLFLFMYCLSSVIVYSLSPNNPNQQSVLLQCLAYVSQNLCDDLPNMSRPSLIIVRRDCQKQTLQVDLLRKIQEFDLFQLSISVVNMPYPGGRDVLVKQLLDIPMNHLNRDFISEVEGLLLHINNAKVLKCNGQPLNMQTQSLLMASILKYLNSNRQFDWKGIWNDVNEGLAIEYYNCYLQTYSQELQKQLQNETPYDKYGMYKKLANIKKKANKKMSHYQKPFDSAIFQRYKDKLEQTIKNKEMLVKNVNQAKSRQTHQTNYRSLANDLNAIDYKELIQNYCKSNLDEQKTDVLLQQFEKIIYQNPPTYSNLPPTNPHKLQKTPANTTTLQLVKINQEIQQLNKKISEKSKIRNENENNNKMLKSTLQQKMARLRELEIEYENLANEPRSVVQQLNKNQELLQLQQQKLKLTQIIENCDKQMQILKRQKQNNLKQTTARLEKELQIEEQTYRRLKNEKKVVQAYEPKANMAGNSSKKTCCALI